MTRIDSHFRSDVGQKRTNNEDYAGAFEPKDSHQLRRSGSLYVVADGLGGHQFGEKASSYAVETLLKVYYEAPDIPPEKRLRDIIQQVNQGLIEYARKNVPSGEKVATTVVAAVVRNGTLQVAHVGDSRAYLIRDGEIRQITRDHSFVGELIRSGSITEAEAQKSPYRNRLMRSVGGGEGNLEVDIAPPVKLSAGDLILLCTDGLTQYATKDDLLAAASHGTAHQIVERLIQFANTRGGTDNITVSIIKYGKKAALSALPSWKTLAAIGAGVVLLALLTLIGIRFVGGLIVKSATPTPTLLPTSTVTLIPTMAATIEPTRTLTPIPSQIPLSDTPVPPVLPNGTLVICQYIIKPDDTVSDLAILFGVDEEKITRLDGSRENMNVIYTGEVLIINDISSEACTNNGGTVQTPTEQQ